MRRGLCSLLLILALAAPAHGEDDPAKEPAPDPRLSPEVVESRKLERQTVALNQKQKFLEAIPLARRVLELRQRVLPPGDGLMGSAHFNLGMVLKGQGLYREARQHLEKSLQIMEALRGKDHKVVAEDLAALAQVLAKTGDLQGAKAAFIRAIAIQTTSIGGDHPETLATKQRFGLHLLELGALDRALALFQEVEAAQRKKHGDSHPEVASALNNRGLVHVERGEFEAAVALAEQALAITEANFGAKHPEVAISLANLGQILVDQGAYSEAERVLKRSLAVLVEALGPAHLYVGILNGRVGTVALRQRRFGDAERHARLARKIVEEVQGTDTAAAAKIRSNLGVMLVHAGKAEEALPLFEESRKIYERDLGKEHPDVAGADYNLGFALSKLKRHAPAALALRRSLEGRKAAYGPQHPLVAAAALSLADALAETGKHAEAKQLYLEALASHEARLTRRLSTLTSSEARSMVHAAWGSVRGWLRIAPKLGETGYDVVLRFRGLAARAVMEQRRTARIVGRGDPAKLEALREAESRIAVIASTLPPREPKKTRASRRALWRKTYADAVAARDALWRELEKKHAALGTARARIRVNLSAIRSALRDDAAVVDIVRVGKHYMAWVYRRTGDVSRVDLGDAAKIDEAGQLFAEFASDPGVQVTEKSWRDAAQALHGLVWAPLAARLDEGVRVVYLVPDSALATVPIGALPGHGKATYLMDQFDLRFLTTPQDLVARDFKVRKREGVLVVGGVDYDNAAPPKGSEKEAATTPVRPRAKRTFLALPGAAAEAKAVRASASGTVELLRGAAATEAAVARHAESARTLHIATHGFVRTDVMRGLRPGDAKQEWLGGSAERRLASGHDPLLLAGLALAGANVHDGGGTDDGIMTALEVSGLDLDGVDLVVLSACETALGLPTAGNGVIGLVQAFHAAGAQQVVGSQWLVDDEATRLLMTALYKHLRPGSDGARTNVGSALREAQRLVRARPRWSHPFYWAAWTAWGAPPASSR